MSWKPVTMSWAAMSLQSPTDSRREVLSLVERGWRGARECSLILGRRQVRVRHLVKGWVSPDVRALIVLQTHESLNSVPRPLFRIRLWLALLGAAARRQGGWVLVDHERTLREIAWWCRVWRWTPVFVQDTDDGYILMVDGQPKPFTTVFG